MADAQRREVFALVPCGKPENRSVAFVLPNFFSDFQNVIMRERDGTRYVRRERNCGSNNRSGQRTKASER